MSSNGIAVSSPEAAEKTTVRPYNLKLNIMKKPIFLLFLAIIASCSKNEVFPKLESVESDSGYTVTLQEAEADLETILSELAVGTKDGQEGLVRTIKYAYSIGTSVNTKVDGNAEPCVHIFNFENDEGFAIMSGDRRVTPLLALTLKGSLPQDSIVDNPGLVIFLANAEDYYISEIERQNVVPAHPNGYIELRDDGSTAVAQLMSTYCWPDSYNGYSFDWSIMNEYPNASSCSSLAQHQIAVLMRQLGNSGNLDMDYGADGYYLSGEFDTNEGPEYEWPGPFSVSGGDVDAGGEEGESHNYQFKINAVVGIRK